MRLSLCAGFLSTALLFAASATAAVDGIDPPAKSATTPRIDKLTDISLERPNGYDWYRLNPKQAVDRYAEWTAAHRQAP